jgi:hypothetical protein
MAIEINGESYRRNASAMQQSSAMKLKTQPRVNRKLKRRRKPGNSSGGGWRQLKKKAWRNQWRG